MGAEQPKKPTEPPKPLKGTVLKLTILRAGKRIHEGNQPDAPRVQPRKVQTLVPGQDPKQATKAKNRQEIIRTGQKATRPTNPP